MSNLLTAEVKRCLKPGKDLNIIVTVGNRMRRDDGLGPYIASKLKSSANLVIIDAGFLPENIIDRVVQLNPDHIIFIDAADFKGKPGEVRVIDESEISEYTLSTHAVPLKLVAAIIRSEVSARISYVGIQPKDVGFGEGLSREVQRAADEMIKEFKKWNHTIISKPLQEVLKKIMMRLRMR